MRLCDGLSSRSLLWPAWLAVLLLVCGCQTATKSLFTVTGSGWQVQQGQALWRPRHSLPELGGELLLARHTDGRCLMQFAKGPLTMVSAQRTPSQWLIQFPPRHLGFSGHRQPPPRFAWLSLPAALAGEPLPPPFHFERKADGGWRLENTRSGESVEGFLAP